MIRNYLLLTTLFFLLMGSSRPFPAVSHTAGGDTLHYIFMGHCYDWSSGGVETDPRLEDLDYARFDAIMLGGDICSEAFQDYSTVEYLDSLFQLASPDTYYVMGNHDARNENWEWFYDITGRRTFFTHYTAGITVVVLNTTLNPGDCEQLDAQYKMLEGICDTIQQSSHLLILQHHGTWKDVPDLPSSPWNYSNFPHLYYDMNCYMKPATYAAVVYPMLQQVQLRGVQVVNVMGDAGVANKGSEMQTSDGIWFLASGINNSKYANDSLALDSAKKDKVLIFEHAPGEDKLWWEFHDLDSLHGAHQ